MSIDLVAAALWLDMPGNRKLVLVALCERANLQTGLCWPGRDEIAVRASLTERNATPHLQRLEKDGYLRSRRGRSWMHETTRRWVNVQRILQEAETRRASFLAQREASRPTWDDPNQMNFELGDESSSNTT